MKSGLNVQDSVFVKFRDRVIMVILQVYSSLYYTQQTFVNSITLASKADVLFTYYLCSDS